MMNKPRSRFLLGKNRFRIDKSSQKAKKNIQKQHCHTPKWARFSGQMSNT